LASTGSTPTVIEAIKVREVRVLELQQELDALDHRSHLSDAGVSRIEAMARAKVMDWRATMRKQMPIARQVLQKLLRDRLVFTRDAGQAAGLSVHWRGQHDPPARRDGSGAFTSYGVPNGIWTTARQSQEVTIQRPFLRATRAALCGMTGCQHLRLLTKPTAVVMAQKCSALEPVPMLAN
jgi:hypothetical protein